MSVNSVSPAALFGGTWEAIENTFLIAQGNNYQAGSVGGSASHSHTTTATTTGGHTLTQGETPAHTHTRGSMNITGNCAPAHSSGVCWYNVTGCSGAFYSNTSASNCGKPTLGNGQFTGDHMLGFDASRSWTGETSSVGGNGAHSHPQVSTTTDSKSNLPPYLAVYMWKRIN